MVSIGGGPENLFYYYNKPWRCYAVNTQGRSRSRGKQRKERRDSRERIDGRGTKGQKTAILSRYLFSRLRLDSNVFNCPGTVPTFLLPYPGLVKTQPPYEIWASPLPPAAPLRPRPRGRWQRTFLRHGSPLRPASCADTHASVRRGKTAERKLNTNGHEMKRRMCTDGLHRWRPRKFVLLL